MYVLQIRTLFIFKYFKAALVVIATASISFISLLCSHVNVAFSGTAARALIPAVFVSTSAHRRNQATAAKLLPLSSL